MHPRLTERITRKVEISGYPSSYLSWLARQGCIDAIKRNGHWYSTREAIEQYKAETEAGKQKRTRTPAQQQNDLFEEK